MPIPPVLTHPPPRSFKPRRRGLSPARIVAYEQAMARWGIALDGSPLLLHDVFGDLNDVVLDIGFGGGEALVEMAAKRPHERVIGVDVHTPGVAAVLEEIESRGLRNVRIVVGDVIDFVARVPLGSLAAIRVFFPDPWPKHRQRTRRLIRPDVVERLVPLLRTGGMLHMATDAPDYVAQMRRVCDAAPALTGGAIERPSWRPTTRFERRGIDEGRRSVDLVYVASESSSSVLSSAPR